MSKTSYQTQCEDATENNPRIKKVKKTKSLNLIFNWMIAFAFLLLITLIGLNYLGIIKF